jgi:hypothetical protein
LTALGFDLAICLEAFLVHDKNVERTAEFLHSHSGREQRGLHESQ